MSNCISIRRKDKGQKKRRLKRDYELLFFNMDDKMDEFADK